MNIFKRKPSGVDIANLLPGKDNADVGIIRSALNKRYTSALCPIGTNYDNILLENVARYQSELRNERTGVLTKDQLLKLADEYHFNVN